MAYDVFASRTNWQKSCSTSRNRQQHDSTHPCRKGWIFRKSGARCIVRGTQLRSTSPDYVKTLARYPTEASVEYALVGGYVIAARCPPSGIPLRRFALGSLVPPSAGYLPPGAISRMSRVRHVQSVT